MRQLSGYVERVDSGGRFFVVRVPTVGGIVPPPVATQVGVSIPDTPVNLLAELRAWWVSHGKSLDRGGSVAREAADPLFKRIDAMLARNGE